MEILLDLKIPKLQDIMKLSFLKLIYCYFNDDQLPTLAKNIFTQ